MKWKNCFARYENGMLFFGNELFERVYRLDETGLYPISLTDRSANYTWGREGYKGACLCSGGEGTRIGFHTERSADNSGLTVCITLERDNTGTDIYLSVTEKLPFYTIHISNAGGCSFSEEICLPDRHHYKVKAVRLFDQTDGRDTLVQEDSRFLWRGGDLRMHGTLFLLEDYLDGEGVLLLRDTPSYLINEGDVLYADKNHACLMGKKEKIAEDTETEGYDVTVGVGRSADLFELYKMYYKKQYDLRGKRDTFCMSNTWGDRNRDGALNEEFVRREIELAADMGVDAVQLDDGWQQGITANSCFQENGAWDGGYYKADADFWKLHRGKFPNGFVSLADEAAERGVSLGLWFSPDSADDFSNWKRDADTLAALYTSYHIRFFKLDGIRIENQLAERRYLKLLENVTERTGGEVTFNLDITAGRRMGYLWHKEYGTLFVENRYTDWGTYWPHNTLRNLWQLSHYLPAQRLQMEVLNNRRNRDIYGDDPLAPAAYSADYLFAVTMVSNPLLWMELSGLPETERDILRGIIGVYRHHRSRFSEAQVIPIGELPNGTALTGFQLICAQPGEGYLLLFREHTPREGMDFCLKDISGAQIHTELLYSNCKDLVSLDSAVTEEGSCRARIGRERGYALWQYRVE